MNAETRIYDKMNQIRYKKIGRKYVQDNDPWAYEGLDETLWDECIKERVEIGELAKLCNPSSLYCGHFHESHLMKEGDCRGRILAIEEIVEHHSV
jgi:hypothetical protein